MAQRPHRGRRRTALAAAAAALGLLVSGLGLFVVVGPPIEASGVSDVPEGVYVAQTTWGAKHSMRIDSAWFLMRPLWEEKPTGRGVTVAIVDTGVDASHPDLAGAVVAWRDFAGDADGVKRTAPYDDHGHGTHVAGIVAGRGHMQPNPLHLYWLTGLRGVAPDADLIVAKAMREDGRGEDALVAAAIVWALDPNGDGDLSDGADIINLSVGIEKAASDPSLAFVGTETRRAVNLALLRGVVVVVSSGNSGATHVAEPGDIERVITVGATDRSGEPADFTSTGDGFDLLAPGVVISAYPRGLDELDHARDGYAGLAGTSMAAPMVSGLVALLYETDPTLLDKGTDRDHSGTVARVEAILKSSARGVPAGTDGREFGAGTVDAHGALASVRDAGGDFSWRAAAFLVVTGGLFSGLVAWYPARRRRARDARHGDAAAGAPEWGR